MGVTSNSLRIEGFPCFVIHNYGTPSLFSESSEFGWCKGCSAIVLMASGHTNNITKWY